MYTYLYSGILRVIFSTGGGLRACDDELLPCPDDRNGRNLVRVENTNTKYTCDTVELSTILINHAFDLDPVLVKAG